MSTITSLRDELRTRRGEWPAICRATGLSYWWLTKFAQGRIAEPGLSKIEKLQSYITLNPRTDPDDPHRTPAAPEGNEAADPAPTVPVSEAA